MERNDRAFLLGIPGGMPQKDRLERHDLFRKPAPMKFLPLALPLTFLCLGFLRAQPVLPPPAGLDVQADRLQFESAANTVTAIGNVRIRKGAQSLRADVITYNTVTEAAHARGKVVFTNGEQVWRGEDLRYNFITGEGSFPDLTYMYGPFRLRADQANRLNEVQTRLEGVTLTTCEETENPEFAVRSGKVDIYDQKILSLRNPVFYLHGVPFFWLPRFVYDEDREPTNIDVIPGYSSRNGFLLLNSLNRYPAEGYRTKTHLDYRTERGVAFGQDFIWYDPVENRDHTRLKGYLALDEKPYKNALQEERLREQSIDLERERYRLSMYHQSQFGANDTLRAKAGYLSDARVVQDFFRDEFEQEPVPETRATYSSFGDGWTADLELSKQLNADEFGGVNRLPEATLDVPRRRLGDSGLLYESETRAGFLERTRSQAEQDAGREEYESLRLHTSQMLYYPTRHFGWLNLIPRAGFALTHYGETTGSETRVTPVSTVGTNNVISTTLQTNTVQVTGPADQRILPEIGLESSFKAFGLLHDEPTLLGRGLRHVVEPFADYRFIPEPDLTPDALHQFDAIDRLGESHQVAFGVRNKFQTKKLLPSGRHQIHDLANIGVATRYDLRSEADPALGDLLLDAEFRLVDWMFVRFESEYNTDRSEVDLFSTELRLVEPETRSEFTIDQRYRADREHLLQFGYNLMPRGPVGLQGYTRYEIESGEWEEQEIMLRFQTECVGYGLGVQWIAGEQYADGTQDEDEYTVWAQIWLTAFPRGILNLGGR